MTLDAMEADREARRTNMAEGLAKKQEGIQKAIDHAYEAWKDNFREHVAAWADKQVPFTSEHIIEEIGLPTGRIGLHKNNGVGAMMNGQARKGVIRKTGRHVTSRRPGSHGAELTEWIGT
jgi:hypothetical protein